MSLYEELRAWMVKTQIAKRGIRDKRILDAFLKVERHRFVFEADRSSSYGDCPIRIACGQTISQPYMVALMTKALNLSGRERVLEIGTGSGYQAAILGELAKEVVTVERIPLLHETASFLLHDLGYENVECVLSDGTMGHTPKAPYDRIVVTAAAPDVPEALVAQLAEGGLMCIPVGARDYQNLLIITRKNGSISVKEDTSCIFVPLIGEQGWKE